MDVKVKMGWWSNGFKEGAHAQIFILGRQHLHNDSSMMIILWGFVETHHCEVNLNRCTNPERIRIPCFIPAVDQRLPDKVCSDNSRNGDDEAQAQENAYSRAVLRGHLELPH